MSYRPITDTWLLARPKHRYYGAYPAGFLSRARELLGVGPSDLVLHACSGRVLDYPFRGIGANDFTLDIDSDLEPDFVRDVRQPFPRPMDHPIALDLEWDAILADPPYSPDDAAHYAMGADVYPDPSVIVRNAFDVLRTGGRVGILHYQFPRPPREHRLVAVVHVLMGYGNRSRVYTVFEKP